MAKSNTKIYIKTKKIKKIKILVKQKYNIYYELNYHEINQLSQVTLSNSYIR